jgi:hypothetical protein
MHRTSLLVAFIACLPFGGALPLRGQSPTPTVEQQLRSKYRVASVDGNGRILRGGSVFVVAQDGLKANPPSPAGCWYNSHKPGERIKYSTMFEITVPVDLKNQVRLLQVGEKVTVIRMDINRSEVGFCVQTYGDNAPPFRAAVVFQFPQKNYVQPENLKAIQDSITQVFSPIPPAGQMDQLPTPGETMPGPSGEPASVVGLYVASGGRQLRFNSDGSYSLNDGNGHVIPGHYTVSGNTLALSTADGSSVPFSVQGDTIHAAAAPGVPWVRQEDQPPPPPPAPPKLPATYVSAQTPADQLQLNADNTFSLLEAGQGYHGTFVANGNTVELNISDGPKTTATIQGNNLTDSSGQAWVLKEQPAPSSAGGAVLQNQDVIKLIKAGLDDALIIAKIGSSKCQFDTSTDALIELKQGGASAAVLKAIMGAGK